tara:strand:+ start:233 stop:508 length:276 start_codon:yes stop_codon:yes gene_type:complete
MKQTNINEQESNHCRFLKLEQCCGGFYDHDEKAYLFSALTRWAGSDAKAVDWFVSEAIPACGGVTALELCKNNQSGAVITYIRHIELGGFA